MKFKDLINIMDPDSLYSIHLFDHMFGYYDRHAYEYTAKGDCKIHTQYAEREVIQFDVGEDGNVRICLK